MSDLVKSLRKAFQIIEFLASRESPANLSVIASVCGFPVPTAYRMLMSLCSMGYVKKLDNGTYKLSAKLFELSSSMIYNTSLVNIVRPHLDKLSFCANETVHLAIRDENSIIIIYKISKAVGPFQMASKIGSRFPIYSCGVGKAIAYTLPDDEIREMFLGSDILAMTPKTNTDLNEFNKQCHISRERGYALDDEENESGVYCIAMPIISPGKPASYAFSISAFRSFVTEERHKELQSMMEQTRKDILSELFFV